MSDTTCRCGAPTRDARYSCDDCSQRLSIALGEVPWVTDELEVTISRQKGVDYRKVGGGKGGKKDNERPSPVSWGAAEARDNLRAVLVSWVRFAEEEGVRHQSHMLGLPADNLPAISRWLLWRVDGLALLDIGPEAVDEITAAVEKCHRVIDRPADRQYLGECDVCESGRLYARAGSRWAKCEACEAVTDAEEIRDRMLRKLDDRLCTAREIGELSTYLGLRDDRERVRKRVEHWARKGRIRSEAAISDTAVYRFGIVWRLLMAHDESKTSDSVA